MRPWPLFFSSREGTIFFVFSSWPRNYNVMYSYRRKHRANLELCGHLRTFCERLSQWTAELACGAFYVDWCFLISSLTVPDLRESTSAQPWACHPTVKTVDLERKAKAIDQQCYDIFAWAQLPTHDLDCRTRIRVVRVCSVRMLACML